MANATGEGEWAASIDRRFYMLGPVSDLYTLQSYTVGIGFVVLCTFLVSAATAL